MNLLFFDIDGTLLSSQGAGGRSIIRTLKGEFQVREEIARVPIQGQTDRGIATNLFAAHNMDDSPDNWSRFKASYLNFLDEELQQCNGSLLPGVIDLLDDLAGRSQIALALLTGNIEAGAWQKVRYFGVDQFFSWGAFGDEHRDRSDLAKNAMVLAGQKLNFEEIDQVFVIGDTPNDIRCGKAIGATTVAVASAGYSREKLRECRPDFLLDDFSDRDQAISILCSSGSNQIEAPFR